MRTSDHKLATVRPLAVARLGAHPPWGPAVVGMGAFAVSEVVRLACVTPPSCLRTPGDGCASAVLPAVQVVFVVVSSGALCPAAPLFLHAGVPPERLLEQPNVERVGAGAGFPCGVVLFGEAKAYPGRKDAVDVRCGVDETKVAAFELFVQVFAMPSLKSPARSGWIRSARGREL
ncbi:hypothetical protein OF83DRAFT_1179900 [Amylostereum chailletii]|nr:hypothetical protein OF83DRAFT_1179900 [Amylostereum chailletii]